MEYSNKFLVSVTHASVRDKLLQHGKPGKPSSLTTIIIFKTNLSKEEVEAIPGVEFVEEDGMDAPGWVQQRPLSWFLPSASDTWPDYTYNRTGEGVALYVMDSGIRPDHVDFAGRNVETVFSYDGLDYGGDVDGPDHGTMAASCAAGNEHGIAKGVNVYNIRYNWTYSEGIKALDTLFTHYMSHTMPAVLSMSFSSTSNVYDRIFTTLADSGVVLVASAGNYNEPQPRFPALRDDVIAVAACDSSLRPSVWGGGQATNYGPEVDIWAGGSGGVAASIESTSATQWAGGTSSACPLVAGNVCLLLEGRPKLISYDEVLQVKRELTSSAREGAIQYPSAIYDSTPNRYIHTLGTPLPLPPNPPDVEPIPEPTPTPPREDTDEKSSKVPLILGAIALVVLIAIVAL